MQPWQLGSGWGAGTTKRVINHEEEALMGKGMEEEGVGLVGRAWEVDLKETRPPYSLLQVGRGKKVN